MGEVRVAGRNCPLARGQPSLKGTVPLLSCAYQLTRLTIWDLGVCGSQLLPGLVLGTDLQKRQWGRFTLLVGSRREVGTLDKLGGVQTISTVWASLQFPLGLPPRLLPTRAPISQIKSLILFCGLTSQCTECRAQGYLWREAGKKSSCLYLSQKGWVLVLLTPHPHDSCLHSVPSERLLGFLGVAAVVAINAGGL